MKKKCDYCGNYYDDTEKNCPYCCAPNDHIARSSNSQPKTIEELKQWYKDHNLPPEEITRYFIGKNKKEARCIGIYPDEQTGNFVVYKNKDNGQRAIRYEGKDEAYAVNEVYQRLRAEISNQKKRNQNQRGIPRSEKKRFPIFLVFSISIVLILLFSFLLASPSTSRGYYHYNGNEYYYVNNDWYYYDDVYDDWYYTDSIDSELKDNADSYYQSDQYDPSSGVSDFEDSQYWSSDSSDFSDDWDNDSSWDFSDSWDSSSSDWSSDW